MSRPDRLFLPGWWRFWQVGPQWSSTARQRIGVPAAPTGTGDWHLWEAELSPAGDPPGPGAVGDLAPHSPNSPRSFGQHRTGRGGGQFSDVGWGEDLA